MITLVGPNIDMLSMVTLTTQLSRQIVQPQAIEEPLDLLSLARWQNALGMSGEAESTLLLAAKQDMPLEHFHLALHELGMLLKRSDRRREAALQWQQIAVTYVAGMTSGIVALEAHIELAKHFEWQQRDLNEAHRWTQQAISLVNEWDSNRSQLVIADLQYRLTRLERKLGANDIAGQND